MRAIMVATSAGVNLVTIVVCDVNTALKRRMLDIHDGGESATSLQVLDWPE